MVYTQVSRGVQGIFHGLNSSLQEGSRDISWFIFKSPGGFKGNFMVYTQVSQRVQGMDITCVIFNSPGGFKVYFMVYTQVSRRVQYVKYVEN